MKVLVACDKFKGTFSSREIGEMISNALRDIDSTIEADVVQVSDGGDGIIEALRWQGGYSRWKFLSQAANTGRQIQSKYLYNIYQGTAIVESAVTCGMSAIRDSERDVMRLNSYGLGLDIARVLEVRRPRRLVIGVGGTATSDMFLGAAKALGFKFLGSDYSEIDAIPENFLGISRIVKPSLPMLSGVEICVAADVRNPLCGPDGASAVFSPQKGASPDQALFLDAALRHIASVIKRDLGADVMSMPGAGAGGGMAAGIAGLLGGSIISGAGFVLDAIDFGRRAKDCDAIITGEGCFDSQSLGGKITQQIISLGRQMGKRVFVLCGVSAADGQAGVFPLFGSKPGDLGEARLATRGRMADAVRQLYWKMVSE